MRFIKNPDTMKKQIIILASIAVFSVSNAQETNHKLEFGSTLASAELHNPGYADPRLTFLNGLFFRYTTNRFGYRAVVSYSEKTTHFTNAAMRQSYYWGESTNAKDFRLGAGVQYAVVKQKDWLYGFVDLYYRHISSSGFYFGILNQTQNSISNGLDGFAGLGLKFKLAKWFYLSPEFGYYLTTQFTNMHSVSTDLYDPLSGELVSSQKSFTHTDMWPAIKLHLTVKL